MMIIAFSLKGYLLHSPILRKWKADKRANLTPLNGTTPMSTMIALVLG